MIETANSPLVYRFGPYLLNRYKRGLLRDGQPLNLGSRAFDILCIFLSHAGQILNKEQLINAAWPDTVVEESNLRVHISGLRKVLESDGRDVRYIENIPGRGYCFLCDVEVLPQAAQVSLEADYTELPQLPIISKGSNQLIGREREMQEIGQLLAASRCVTLTGPGGIGKTSLAIAVASEQSISFPCGFYFVDFAQHTEDRLVPHVICNALNIVTGEADPLHEMKLLLKDKTVLFVLDNCERFVSEIGSVVEFLSRHAPQVYFLITSREPLRISGEHVYPLEPLLKPPLCVQLRPEDLLCYPASSLFLQRIQAIRPELNVTQEQIPYIVRICNRLDGLPLALELAAARVPLFGFRELELKLDNRFNFLTKGRRTALPRHQTLAAMIQWSYETLTVQEARSWRRLGVFAGKFTLGAIHAVHQDDAYSEHELCDVMDSLVSKSLVNTTWEEGEVSFSLFESMRYYAKERLREHREQLHIQKLLIDYLIPIARQPLFEWLHNDPLDWFQTKQHEMSDIRSVLGWAFSPEGDSKLGVQLVVEATPMFFRALQLSEISCHQSRVWLMLDHLNLEVEFEPEFSCRLCMALGQVWLHVEGASSKVDALFQRGLKIATEHHLVREQVQLLWSLYAHAVFSADDQSVAIWAEQLKIVTDKADIELYSAVSLRTQMVSCYISADFEQASILGAAALKLDIQVSLQNPEFVYCYDHLIAASCYYARTLWISGHQKEALALVRETLARAVRLRQPFAFGHFIVCGLVPVALWSGDLALACHGLECLLKLTNGLAVNIWKEGGNLFRLVIKGIMTKTVVAELLEIKISPFYLNILATLDLSFMPAGLQAQLLAAKPQAWCEAEFLRVRGEAMLDESLANLDAGRNLLVESFCLASAQNAVAWQLKSAIAMAKWQLPEACKYLQLGLQQICSDETSALIQEAKSCYARLNPILIEDGRLTIGV